MIKFEQIQRINSEIKRIKIKGKMYATVPSRVQGYRSLYPNGSIQTEILHMDDDNVVMKTTVYDDEGHVIATGHAQESRTSSPVNKTSYIENCETSAVGRALGMLGIGSDESMASAEEVRRAISIQEQDMPTEETVNDKINAQELGNLKAELDRTGVDIGKLLGLFEVESLEELTQAQYYVAMNKFAVTEDKK